MLSLTCLTVNIINVIVSDCLLLLSLSLLFKTYSRKRICMPIISRGYSSLDKFGSDIHSAMKFESRPTQIPIFFKEKVILKPIGRILGQILSKIVWFFQNFLKFELILAQIWENFAKIDPFMNTKFCFFYKGFIHIPRG